MSDMDAVVEKAARAMYEANGDLHRQRWIDRGRDVAEYDDPPRPPWSDATDYHHDLYVARTAAALEAVGLPALLERVEAAEGLRAEWRGRAEDFDYPLGHLMWDIVRDLDAALGEGSGS